VKSLSLRRRSGGQGRVTACDGRKEYEEDACFSHVLPFGRMYRIISHPSFSAGNLDEFEPNAPKKREFPEIQIIGCGFFFIETWLRIADGRHAPLEYPRGPI
jgi:hypothetical protein